MNKSLEWRNKFSGMVRLFPIPNLVFFPHVIQPLQIFEPRYQQLIQNALADDRLITMAIPLEQLDPDDPVNPEIDSIVTIGTIRHEKKLANGRWNLALEGKSRARIIEEVLLDNMYRSARVEILEDIPFQSRGLEDQFRLALDEAFCNRYGYQSMATIQILQLLQSNAPLGKICDILGFGLEFPITFKQTLLKELDSERRAQLILDQLRPSNPGSTCRPPQFSKN